jgi:hypothetical protein
VAVAVDTGKLLGAGGATTSGRRWRNERWEVDEKSCRNIFCFIVVELSFLYAAPHRRPLLSTHGEDSTCSIEVDDPYWFGLD